jgi:hypothetical protein
VDNPNSQPPPIHAGTVPKSSVSPMLLSAVVYPGTGQLMQRRWAVGAGFAVTFSMALIWFIIKIIAVLQAYYQFAVDFKGATGNAPGVGAILLPFAISTLIYVAGLVDTAVASYRQRLSASRPIS